MSADLSLGLCLRQPQDHIAVAFAGAAQRHEHPTAQPSERMISPGPRITLRRTRTAALCPEPPSFSFAIVGAMLTQLIVGSREVQGGDS